MRNPPTGHGQKQSCESVIVAIISVETPTIPLSLTHVPPHTLPLISYQVRSVTRQDKNNKKGMYGMTEKYENRLSRAPMDRQCLLDNQTEQRVKGYYRM